MGHVSVITKNESKISIIGTNILYNNGILTAYYILPLVNYTTASSGGILSSITSVTNLLTGLASQRDEIAFTISRIAKVIKSKDVVHNLIDTIKLYAPEYDIPIEFTANIKDNVQEYCLLGIDIQQKEIVNIEDSNFMDTAKQIVSRTANNFFNVGNINIDEEKILAIENNIFSIIKTRCMRASDELVFYNYVSNLFPSYEISYDRLSYINSNNFTTILGAVTQTVEDNFGYFIMHNEGVDIFGQEPQDTYGCILDIKAFPLKINSMQFPMDYPGMQVNIKTVKKEDAALSIKRQRSADKYEFDQAAEAGAESERLEETARNINIATNALKEIEEGTQMCKFNATILVTSTTKEGLREKINLIMSDLKDRDILPAKSLSQGLDFLNGYVKLIPQKYDHFTTLQFPLSFQLNSGSLVGDADSKFFMPAIGEDLG